MVWSFSRRRRLRSNWVRLAAKSADEERENVVVFLFVDGLTISSNEKRRFCSFGWCSMDRVEQGHMREREH